MEHTKTPWYVTEGVVVRGGDMKTVARAHLRGANGHGQPEANALLISAAPDLLAACKEFVRKVDCGQARSKRSYAQMKAAIAKAENA